MNKQTFKFEYRELPESNYYFVLYIEGLERFNASDYSRNLFNGWFLLSYEGNGVFRTDGAFEEDEYRLEVINENTLKFIPEFEFNRSELPSEYKIFRE